MKIREKMMLDRDGLSEHGPINIVIFGDSVSHGAVNGYMDYENVYWNLLKRKLYTVRDYVPINMICASIGGTTARASVERLESQVLKHEPDLVIVCFGLNDVNRELEDYLWALEQIFGGCLERGLDVIFMTPNMLNTYVALEPGARHYEYAHKTAKAQNEGRMDLFMDSARTLARRMGVPVCDCYAKWKELSKTQDVTMLLANRINHPTSEMHHLFADALYEMIMEEGDASAGESDDAMFQA